jgi:transcriptional regulator with XRE-family HTH domain
MVQYFDKLGTMKVQRLPDKYLEGLGLRIRLTRTYLRLEQKDLAQRLKTGQSQVSKIEAGKAAPSLYHLLTIKELVDKDQNIKGELSWNWLLNGQGNIFET